MKKTIYETENTDLRVLWKEDETKVLSYYEVINLYKLMKSYNPKKEDTFIINLSINEIRKAGEVNKSRLIIENTQPKERKKRYQDNINSLVEKGVYKEV